MLNLKSPLVLPQVSNSVIGPDYAEGRLAFTDANEVIIGSKNGFNRESFPYSHTEILTEIGTKTQRVFSLHNRRQTKTEFFITPRYESLGNTPQVVKVISKEGGYGYDLNIKKNTSVTLLISTWRSETNVPIEPPYELRILYGDTITYQRNGIGIVEQQFVVGDEFVQDGEYYRPLLLINDLGDVIHAFIKKTTI
jgi:hypothetical protein